VTPADVVRAAGKCLDRHVLATTSPQAGSAK